MLQAIMGMVERLSDESGTGAPAPAPEAEETDAEAAEPDHLSQLNVTTGTPASQLESTFYMACFWEAGWRQEQNIHTPTPPNAAQCTQLFTVQWSA